MTSPSQPHLDPSSGQPYDRAEPVRARTDDNEFWGDSASWSTRDHLDASDASDESAHRLGLGAAGRWWRSAGRTGATRTHSVGAPAVAVAVPFDDIADGPHDHDPDDAGWDEAWELSPSEPPRSGVDPLLARLGGLAVILTLLVPVVLGFASDDGETVLSASPATQPIGTANAAASDATTADPIAADPVETVNSADTADTADSPDATSLPAPAPVPSVADAVAPETSAIVETTSAPPATETLVDCALDYEVAAGDFWIRIADGSGATLRDILAANGATVSTPLYPGRSICLPAGSEIPSRPAATATSTTVAVAVKAPTTTSKTTEQPTTTTTKTTASPPIATTPPPPAATASPDQVEAIIRAVWPDELEERALEIAWRESNYVSTAKNSCCYGLFQVYWSVHEAWLDDIGITSPDQLYDPTTNSRAALALYDRSGGWGPWGP